MREAVGVIETVGPRLTRVKSPSPSPAGRASKRATRSAVQSKIRRQMIDHESDEERAGEDGARTEPNRVTARAFHRLLILSA